MSPRGRVDDSAIDAMLVELDRAADDSERGDIVKKYARLMNCHASTIYRAMRRKMMRRGRSIDRRSDYGKPRCLPANRMDYVIDKIVAVKRMSGISTEIAIDMVVNLGYCSSDEIPSRSTLDRRIRQEGLALRKRPKAAITVLAEYPNQVWYVDATVNPQYYLRQKDGKIVRDPEIYRDKNHFEDILRERKWQKIWDFYMVDRYSAAFYFRSYLTSGESAANWIDFLQRCFRKKEGLPVYGLPFNLLSDQSPGLKAAFTQNFLHLLEIKFGTHQPKHPRAKGAVESRIGAVKRGFSRLTKIVPAKSIDELNEFNEAWINNINTRKGHYQKWLEITSDQLRVATDSDLYNATHKSLTCTVDNLGCVSVHGKKLFVNENMVGEQVDVFIYRDRMIAVDGDGIRFELKPPVSVTVGDYHAWKTSDAERRIERIDEIAAEIRRDARAIGITSILPDNSTNVVLIPKKGTAIKGVVLPGKPDSFDTPEDAWFYFIDRTGLPASDLPEDDAELINQAFANFIRLSGSIPRAWIDGIITEYSVQQISL